MPSKPELPTGADPYAVDFEATTGTTNRWGTQLSGSDVVYPDRAQADARLLTYTTGPLEMDYEVTGHPIVSLWLSSTHSDGALFVYLEDVDERGRVTYVTEGQLRLLHRAESKDPPPYAMLTPYLSFKGKDAAPMVPGRVERVHFSLIPTSTLFRRGHRIRIAIGGADKDTFVRLPATGTPTLTIERNATNASYVELPVIRR
jgi:putative CocE/NonD family hydrolase